MCVNLIGIAGGWPSTLEGDMAGSMVIAAEPVRLDPVVVTGTQVAVPVSELPSAVTVIDREAIKSRQVADVQQLLRTVPGLSVTQSGSRGGQTSVFPRGGNANYSLVLVDGVPVNNAGGAFEFSDLTTDNIERIEIIRGPQSALYGSNAIGGLIQLFTRRGRGPVQGGVSLTGGSFNTVEGHGAVSGGSERVGGSLGVGSVSTSGHVPINHDYRDFTVSSGLDYQPLEALKLAFSARGSFERAALHHQAGVMLPQDGGVPHPSIQWLSSPQVLLRMAQNEPRATGPAGCGRPVCVVTLLGAGHLGHDHLRLGLAMYPHLWGDRRADPRALLAAAILCGGRCGLPDAATVLPRDVSTRDACVSPWGQLLSVLSPAAGALLCELPLNLSGGTAPTTARLDETPDRISSHLHERVKPLRKKG
jgi:TonB-dependent Receptor Plug Domain